MHGDLGWIQDRIADGTPPLKILQSTYLGGPGGVLLWYPVQVILGVT